jgi:hypothetical protein
MEQTLEQYLLAEINHGEAIKQEPGVCEALRDSSCNESKSSSSKTTQGILKRAFPWLILVVAGSYTKPL